MGNADGFSLEARRAEAAAQRAAATQESTLESAEAVDELTEIFCGLARDLLSIGVKPTPLGKLELVTVGEQKIRVNGKRRKIEVRRLGTQPIPGEGWTLTRRVFGFTQRSWGQGNGGGSDDGTWYAMTGLVLTTEGLLAWTAGNYRWSGTISGGPVIDRSVPITGYLTAGPAPIGHWLWPGDSFAVSWANGPKIYRSRDRTFRVDIPAPNKNREPDTHSLSDWLYASATKLKEGDPAWR